MNTEEKLKRAAELKQQIGMLDRQIQRLYDEATRETYWLKQGDLIATFTKRRRGLTRKVVTTPHYWLVERISSYAHHRFEQGGATVWVWPVKSETGVVVRITGACLQQYQLDDIQRLGHAKDYDTAEHVDLQHYLKNKPPANPL